MGTIVRMDRQGRVLIPAKVRRRVGSRLFVLEETGGVIVLRPIKAVRPSDLFDAIEIDVDRFTDSHELRRAIHERGNVH